MTTYEAYSYVVWIFVRQQNLAGKQAVAGWFGDCLLSDRLQLEMVTVIAAGAAAVTVDLVFQFSELLVRK